MKKKLLWIVPTLTNIGGSEHLTVTFSLLLAKRGWRICLYTQGHPHKAWLQMINSKTKNTTGNVEVFSFETSGNISLSSVFCGSEWDAILFMPIEHPWEPMLSGSDDIPVLGLEPTDCSSDCWWLDGVDPRFIARLDGLIVLTEAAKRDAISRWPNIKNINLLSNTLPTDPGILSEPDKSSPFICISRLSGEKGIDYLLASVAIARDDGVNLHIDVWGEGPERKRLTEQSRALGVSHLVRFCGVFNPSVGTANILKKYRGLVLASLFEGMPVALLEAAACGRAIISTATSGSKALLGPAYPWLTPIGDTRAMADALIECWQDDILRQTLSQHARQCFVKSFSPEKAVVQLEAALITASKSKRSKI